MSTPAPLHVVCAVIQNSNGDRLLLAQRAAGKSLGGFWEFPGGKVEPGEAPAAALQREIAEELGCGIDVLQAGPPVLHAYEWGEIWLEPFLCRLTAGTSQPEAREHAALAWAKVGDLDSYDLAPADVPVVAWLRGGSLQV